MPLYFYFTIVTYLHFVYAFSKPRDYTVCDIAHAKSRYNAHKRVTLADHFLILYIPAFSGARLSLVATFSRGAGTASTGGYPKYGINQ